MDKTALAILFGLLAIGVLALGGFIAMLWLGVIYGYFGLLAPLGYFESTLTLFLTTGLVGFIAPTNVKS